MTHGWSSCTHNITSLSQDPTEITTYFFDLTLTYIWVNPLTAHWFQLSAWKAHEACEFWEVGQANKKKVVENNFTHPLLNSHDTYEVDANINPT